MKKYCGLCKEWEKLGKLTYVLAEYRFSLIGWPIVMVSFNCQPATT